MNSTEPAAVVLDAEWWADYDRATVEQKACEREARREKWKWQHLVQRTILHDPDEKHVLRCLADHAWAGPDPEDRGRVDGQCCVLKRTIMIETGIRRTKLTDALAGLVHKGIIEVQARGRPGGGRGASVYRILPSNPYEVKDWRAAF